MEIRWEGMVHLHFDAHIIPTASAKIETDVAYMITYNPNLRDSMYIEI